MYENQTHKILVHLITAQELRKVEVIQAILKLQAQDVADSKKTESKHNFGWLVRKSCKTYASKHLVGFSRL